MLRFKLRTVLLLVVAAGGLLLLVALVAYGRIGSGRQLKVNAAYPTETKPQSKLWHAQGHWWAWLPDGIGSSLWRRDDSRWRRVGALDAWLSELPGHADVWSDGETVCAVLAGDTQLSVAQLEYDSAQRTYVLAGSIQWSVDSFVTAEDKVTETAFDTSINCATITRDGDGRWWIAFVHDGRVLVRHSMDALAEQWGDPFIVARDLDDDDLCTIIALRDGIGVVWTDQVSDALCFRQHTAELPLESWMSTEVITQGDGVANNHLNAVVASDGRAYVVTKTSKYIEGEPLLNLWVRQTDDRWESHPYADYRKQFTPTRPIVLLSPDEEHLHLVHTSLDSSVWNSHRLVSRTADRLEAVPTQKDVYLVGPHLDMRNATGCKGPLPRDAAWIVLASDRLGNVYEGEIPQSSID